MNTRTETCATCRWWDGYVTHGWCHHQPPTPRSASDGDGGCVAVYPHTDPEDWCAQWLGKPRGSEAPHA